MSQLMTQFESVEYVQTNLRGLYSAVRNLNKLGFGSNMAPPTDPAVSAQARQYVVEAILTGERLLLYHKRLAISEAAYSYLHEKGIIEHWDRYAKTSRIAFEIQQLTVGLDKLTDGYEQLERADERFIVDDIDLPEILEREFIRQPWKRTGNDS